MTGSSRSTFCALYEKAPDGEVWLRFNARAVDKSLAAVALLKLQGEQV